MGVVGVYRAEPAADFTSVTITMILFWITAKKIFRNGSKNDMIK